MQKDIQKYIVAGAVVIFLISMLLMHGGGVNFWLEFWWMFPTALIIALTINTVGISGAALFAPFFILVFPLFAHSLTPMQSVKLGLITESFGLSSSALAFYAFGLIDKKIGWYSILGALPFVVGGALLSSFIPQTILFIMIASLLASSVVFLNVEHRLRKSCEAEKCDVIVSKKGEGEEAKLQTVDGKKYIYVRTMSGYRKRLLGYGIGGFFQGAAGFGIGELGIVSMIITHVPIRVAIGTSHLIVASTAIIASLIHISLSSATQVSVPWNILLMTVPAAAMGGQLAPHVAAKLPTDFLRKLISAIFLIAAILLVFVAFHYSPSQK